MFGRFEVNLLLVSVPYILSTSLYFFGFLTSMEVAGFLYGFDEVTWPYLVDFVEILGL